MPRKATPTATTTASAAPAEQPQVNQSEQVRQALKAHPGKMPKELAELLQAQGLDVSAAFVSQVKIRLGGKKKGKRKAVAAAPAAQAAPAVPKDAVSLGRLQKAKKLSWVPCHHPPVQGQARSGRRDDSKKGSTDCRGPEYTCARSVVW
jgi:hypothetical protein